MKVSQLKDAMLVWVPLFGERGDAEASAIRLFVGLLEGHETKTVAALANKLKGLSVPAQQIQGLATVNTLVQLFGGLARFCNHLKAPAAAKDFEAIATALSHYGNANVDDFFAVAKVALSARSQAVSRGGATVDPSLVRSYVDKLQRATEETGFQAVVEALKKDAAVSKDALTQIANAFGGHVGSFPSKKAAYEELQVAYIEQARFRNKIRATDKQ